MTNSNEANKILRMLSREDEFARNGGGQFVAKTRAYKNKKKYNRRDNKKELRDLNLGSFFLLFNTQHFLIS